MYLGVVVLCVVLLFGFCLVGCCGYCVGCWCIWLISCIGVVVW